MRSLSTCAPLALSMILAAATPVAAQLAIDDVIVTSGPNALDGSPSHFFIDPAVFGAGIASVVLSTASGASTALVETDVDEFVCDLGASYPCGALASLAEIDAFGDLTFEIIGELGESDTVVVPQSDWAPAGGQPGLPVTTSPAPGVSAFPPGNLLEWSSAPAWADAVQTELIDPIFDAAVDEQLFFDPTTTSWTPTGIVPGRLYVFDLSFFDIDFLEDARTSTQGRAYLFTAAYQQRSTKFLPEPNGAGVWLAALASLAFAGRVRSARAG